MTSKAFAVHGFKDNQLFVTIPITLDTLKGLALSARRNRNGYIW